MLRLFLGSLELVFADILPKPFGQFGSGEWVFADHCGQRGVGLHGFAKGVFWGGGFLRGWHRAIRTRRAWEPSEKSTLFSAVESGYLPSARALCCTTTFFGARHGTNGLTSVSMKRGRPVKTVARRPVF